MNKKRAILTFVIVAALLAVTVIIVGKTGERKMTGEMNYPYGDGRAWVSIDVQKSILGNVSGTMNYNSDNGEDTGSWDAVPVCMEFFEIDGHPGFEELPQLQGKPAIVVELHIVETAHLEPDTYMKFILVDGGQPSSKDLVELIGIPGAEEPSDCEAGPVFWSRGFQLN